MSHEVDVSLTSILNLQFLLKLVLNIVKVLVSLSIIDKVF